MTALLNSLMIDISRCIFLDVETLPTDRQEVVDYLDARIEVPGTMSKAETIEAWRNEKRPSVLAEAVAKTSFEGGLGRIASVAFAVGDGPVVSATSAKPASGDVPAGYDLEQERKLLLRMWDAFDRVHRETGRVPTIVGHNVVSFDIRWLWKRSVVLDVAVPTWWPLAAKPWEKDAVYDTMVAWEGVGGRISQDRLALCLGLPRKEGFDGSMVASAWEAGEFERIRAYNVGDVETVRAIWKRLTGYQEPVVASEAAAETVPDAAEEAVSVTAADPTPTTRPGLGFSPGLRPAVRAEASAHTTRASA